jgi:hypothetical protein
MKNGQKPPAIVALKLIKMGIEQAREMKTAISINGY